MTDSISDPLAKLKKPAAELDRQRLAELLDGYCFISDDGQIRLEANFNKLDSQSKVLVVILAQKVANALGLSETDHIASRQIERITGLGASARVRLMELRKQRLVESINGNYSVPNYSIIHVSLNLAQNQHVVSRKAGKAGAVRSKQPESEGLTKLMQISQEQIGEDRLNMLLAPGKYLERALVVLLIAREQGIEDLTPAEITRFLKEKIRVNVIRENISLALGRGTRYVDRSRTTGGIYSYRIMVAGEQLLNDLLTQHG